MQVCHRLISSFESFAAFTYRLLSICLLAVAIDNRRICYDSQRIFCYEAYEYRLSLNVQCLGHAQIAFVLKVREFHDSAFDLFLDIPEPPGTFENRK